MNGSRPIAESRRRVLPLSFVFAAVATSAALHAAPGYKGMSYTPWSENVLFSSMSDQSIGNAQSIGVDTVALNVFAFQDNETATNIALDFNYYSASLPSVAYAIGQIHSRGMQVLLKPNVDLRNGVWRGNIPPSPAWFASYRTFMRDWANFAQQHGVEILSVGTEFNRLQGQETEWRSIVADVRARYGGLLTYSANHDAYQNLPWWDAVDLIGIDAYFSLANHSDPSLTELTSAWNSHANTIENWRNSRGLSQRVIFAEVGYRSVNGAVRQPWAWTGGGTVDLQEQADAYRSLLTVMNQRPWFDGAFWWNWETDPNAGGPNDLGYTPQNKPAQDVLREYYVTTGQPGIRPILNYLVSSWETGLEGWHISGFQARPTTIQRVAQNATDGTHSLRVRQTGSGFSWNIKLDLDADERSALQQILTGRVQDYVLQFDLVYDDSELPVSLQWVNGSVAINNQNGWRQVDGIAAKSDRLDQAIQVELPLSQFSNLSPNSPWYQLVLAVNGAWGTGDLGVFYDDVRLVNVNPAAPADLDIDGDLDVDDWQLFISHHMTNISQLSPDASFSRGDLDADRDNDFDDFLIFGATYDTVHGRGSFAALLADLPEPTGSGMIGWFVLLSVWNRSSMTFRGPSC